MKPLKTPADIADRYFACVRAKDIDGWMALFAEGAEYVLPNGSAYRGHDAIRAFQAGVFASGSPFPTPGARLIDGNEMVVQVEAALPDGTVRRTANFYSLDASGRIARLSIYKQGW